MIHTGFLYDKPNLGLNTSSYDTGPMDGRLHWWSIFGFLPIVVFTWETSIVSWTVMIDTVVLNKRFDWLVQLMFQSSVVDLHRNFKARVQSEFHSSEFSCTVCIFVWDCYTQDSTVNIHFIWIVHGNCGCFNVHKVWEPCNSQCLFDLVKMQ